MTGPLPFHSERFELVRRLGEGGMGVVYEARDRSNGELVALKTLRELEPSSLLRFKQEFRVLADVAHPNLVELGELVEEGGQWYFTMELVDGVDFVEFVTGVPSTTTDLRPRLSADAPLGNEGPTPRGSGPATDDATIAVGAKRPRTPETATESESTRLEAPSTGGTSDSWGSLPIQDEPTTGAGPGGEETSAIHLRRRRRRGPLDEARLRPALAQLFDALAELHRRGLVHRDVKPSNILVERDGRVVLLDLGIATHVDPLDQAEDEEGLVVGTASFMAPEQAKGAAPAPSADLYGVGVVLYEALVGALPFRGTPSQILRAKQRTSPPRPIDVDPSVPVDLDALCMDLLDRDPARRPSALEARMRLAEAPRTAPTTLARPIFVGREPELARLAAGFAEAWARRRSVPFVVVGPPGVGKTELVRTALRRATHELEHVLVLRGRCYQQESVPFKAFDGVIDALARELAILPEEALRGVLPREIDDLVRLFPVLGRVPGLERASLAPADAENRAESRGRAFEALRSLLVRLSASRPVILVLDDLQWADAESHVLLRAILAPPAPPPIAVVATARPELLSAIDAQPDGAVARALAGFARVDVSGLGEGETVALVDALAGDLGPDVVRTLETLCASAGGHPMLVRELVRAAAEGRDLGDGPVEARLDAVLWSRIERLSEHERGLLALLAVSGTRTSRDLLADVAGMKRRDCARALRRLRAEQLVRLEARGPVVHVEPYHDRVRESVASHLGPEVRTYFHRRLAEGMRAHGLDVHDPLSYVRHVEASGNVGAAGAAALEAARRNEGSLAFELRAALLGEALRLRVVPESERAATERAIADAFRAAGRANDAARHYLAATETPDAALRRSSRRLAAEQLILSGDIRRGTLGLERALDDVGVRRPPRFVMMAAIPLRERRLLFARDVLPTRAPTAAPSDVEGLDVRAAVFRSMNLVDPITTAYHLYGHGLLARELGDVTRFAESFVMAVMAYATMHGTTKADVIARLRASLAPATRTMPESVKTWVEACEATIDGVSGGASAMIDRLRAVEKRWLAEPERDAMKLAMVRMALLESFRTAGRLAEGVEYSGRMIREAERTSDLLLETFAVKAQSLSFLVRDDPEGALAALDRPLWTSPDSGFHIHHLYELRARVEVDLYRGEVRGLAERHGRRLRQAKLSMMSLLRAFKLELGSLEARMLLAEPGRFPSWTASRIRRIAGRVVDPGNPEHLVRASMLRAGAAALEGDRATAIAELTATIEGGEARRLALEPAVARTRLASLVDSEEARKGAEDARGFLVAEGVRDPDRLVSVFLPPVGLFAPSAPPRGRSPAGEVRTEPQP